MAGSDAFSCRKLLFSFCVHGTCNVLLASNYSSKADEIETLCQNDRSVNSSQIGNETCAFEEGLVKFQERFAGGGNILAPSCNLALFSG
jgi:hypothetical protein